MTGDWLQWNWDEYSTDLNAYIGGSVWIRFRLESNGDPFTQPGFYIDDVNVTCS